MGRTAGIKFLRSEQFMKKTVLQKNKKHHRGLGRSDTFDGWVLMMPMVIILYLFVCYLLFFWFIMQRNWR